ncbi:MAG: DUF3418 domain-containing protein, partial [Thermoguttaceae bacterium]|nr:DUF3418 domain-containing protein [Thermoguttaceae bacterium]
PKICLEIGRGIYGKIGHTQPRRIAARTIARRLSEELKTEPGTTVGFKVRFTDHTVDSTLVKIMTDGVLLAESQTDPLFEQYDTIIIDEAHERSLNIDFLLGMMKRVLQRRRDLKLIITSATIDAKRFAEHFAVRGKPAPIVEIAGRTYPIEIAYHPLDELREEDENGRLETVSETDLRARALRRAVDLCARREPGDILIFFPTERDIREAAKILGRHPIPGDDASRKSDILPLYARLSFDEQKKIFEKSRWRKIVLATNVAESSLTVPGIRFVIDFGTARLSRYSARSRTERLPIEPISRAAADQRAGRCGRVGPGFCIRLYSEEDYRRRDEFTTPEIRRTNLASVILRTLALRLGDVEKFPFLDPPGRGTVSDGYKTLFELGAIDREKKLLPLGKKLARIPTDPRIGRMLLAAAEEGVLPEMLVLASVLEIQDPRERPAEQAGKADTAHAALLDPGSDFLAYLKIWRLWLHWKETLSSSKRRKACAENFLSFRRMFEWSDLHAQLTRLVRDMKIVGDGEVLALTGELPKPMEPQQPPLVNQRRGRLPLPVPGKMSAEEEKKYDALHRAILSGLLIGIAQRGDDGLYSAASPGGKFALWPGSGLTVKKPSWIVAAERVETSRKYLRCCARIRPEWLEPLAGHLLEKNYFDPFWCQETGYVHACEKVTLFGLTIVPKRRVSFGPIDPVRSRALFIRGALVEGQFSGKFDFFLRNQELLARCRARAAKMRLRGIILDDQARYAFYDRRLPAEVYDTATLKKWYSRLNASQKEALLWTEQDILVPNAPSIDETAFPDTLPAAQEPIALEYRFAPGQEDDGLTATVTPDALARGDLRRAAGWMIPGLLAARITTFLKALPKNLRRSLVPIPSTAQQIADRLPFGEGDFYTLLSREVSRLTGELVTPADFDASRLAPEHLLNVRVVDDRGETLAEGRDIDQITDRLGVQARKVISTICDPKWTRGEITSWDFGSLPESVTLRRGGRAFTLHPGLYVRCPSDAAEEFSPYARVQIPLGETEKASAAMRLFETPDEAALHTRQALDLLFAAAVRRDTRVQADWLPDGNKMQAIAATLPEFPFKVVSSRLIARRALMIDEAPLPRCEGDFNRLITEARGRIGRATIEVTQWLRRFLTSFQDARRAIDSHRAPQYTTARGDCRRLFERLLYPGFYQFVPMNWLWEYPRYFQAAAVRYESISAGKGAQDRQYSEELNGLWDDYEALARRHAEAGLFLPELEHYRWMLEEYTVSLFAQKLKTVVKVSAVRLKKQRDSITGQ